MELLLIFWLPHPIMSPYSLSDNDTALACEGRFSLLVIWHWFIHPFLSRYRGLERFLTIRFGMQRTLFYVAGRMGNVFSTDGLLNTRWSPACRQAISFWHEKMGPVSSSFCRLRFFLPNPYLTSLLIWNCQINGRIFTLYITRSEITKSKVLGETLNLQDLGIENVCGKLK